MGPLPRPDRLSRVARVLVLAGGSPHAHDFAAAGLALADLVEGAGHHVELADHPDAAATQLGPAVDALVVCGLWWRMRGHAYDRWRPRYGYETSPATRRAITDFVGAGGGLLAVHTAVICFDDWVGWGPIVGGAWRWGVSSHPDQGAVDARIVAEHPVVAGLPERFELVDEVYGDLDLVDGIEVLAVAKRSVDDADQPVVWAHRYRAGRVVFDGFGHDEASIRHADNGRLLRQALSWIVDDSDRRGR